MKRYLFLLAAFLFSTGIFAQTVEIDINVIDGFLNVPIQDVKVTLHTADSVLVTDSVKKVQITDTKGNTLLWHIFIAEAQARGYLVHASCKGYGDEWLPIDAQELKKKEVAHTIKMRKMRDIDLDEVVVKATKVKMFYKGDTLVYNADAFKLPDGSMLDALIRQLPGVTMDANGQIFVNGRRVDELLLGSRSFMRGNKKVLMENLPYYTVKHLKVYEKQTDKSEALGYDVEPRKYVMDVNLKNEYSQGYIANVEAAGGTEDRWLGRGFLLGFTDLWRYSVMANANNVNESRHIGEHGQWTPATMPQSLLTTRSVATDLDYQSKNKNVKNNFTANYTSSDNTSEMRSRYEQFLERRNPVSLTESNNKSDNWKVKLDNELTFKKPFYYNFKTHFGYEKWNSIGGSNFRQWDGDDLTATKRTDAIGKGRTWNLCQEVSGAFNINKEKQWRLSYYLMLLHDDSQSWHSDRFDTRQHAAQTSAIRHNAADVSDNGTGMLVSTSFLFKELFANLDFGISNDLSYDNRHTRDYLYHPDTLVLASQLDMLTAITDPSNSYDSRKNKLVNTVAVKLSKQTSYKLGGFVNVTYDRWRLELNVPVNRQTLDYNRGAIDTIAHETKAYLTPVLSFRHITNERKHDFRMSASYNCYPADMLSRIAFRDDRQPLVVKEGNTALKGTATANANIDYTRQYGKTVSMWHAATSFRYVRRDVAQSVAYNPSTGVYTYKPMNISGAYSATANTDLTLNFGKQKFWTLQTNMDASFNHDKDHAMLAGETMSHENAVNNIVVHNGTYLQYQKDALSLRASGDIRWRHSEGKMFDFETLNALDFNYGLSARYTIPRLNTTLSVDGTMYSRRGYGSSDLNTNDFVMNASLSQSLFKGKVIAKIEAFDILHQLSSTQYHVNAQGRTETWYRSLPHYVMLHLAYHWNKNPKKP